MKSINKEAALKHRLKALILSWYSTANWKHHDAFMTDDEHIERACLLEAHAYETCASNLQRLANEL